jgi:prepilin-type N-terminal cleavage/methylation domain-containing protein
LRAGFTLIELIAVLAILSILAFFLYTNLGDAQGAAKQSLTEAQLRQVEAACSEYENEYGDWPGSTFTDGDGAPPNELNLGSEALVVAFWSEEWQGGGLDEDALVNTDGDVSRKQLTTFGVRDLFELADQWENPIAYFHHRDYGRVDVYVTWDPDTGEEVESSVVALKSDKTGRWAKPRGVQLISAGADGRFGTEDDLTNFR